MTHPDARALALINLEYAAEDGRPEVLAQYARNARRHGVKVGVIAGVYGMRVEVVEEMTKP